MSQVRGNLQFYDNRHNPTELVAYCARHQLAKPTRIPLHQLDQNQIVLVEKGTCELCVNEASLVIDGGHAALLPKGGTISSALARTRGVVFWLGLAEQPDIPSALQHEWQSWQQQAMLRRLGCSPDTFAAVGALHHQAGTDATGWPWIAAQYRCVAALLAPQQRDQGAIQAVAAAYTHMQQDLAADHPIELLAARCQLSVGAFRRAFKKAHGHSPYSWLQHERVAAAQRHAAANPTLLLEDIARTYGFNSARHLQQNAQRLLGRRIEL